MFETTNQIRTSVFNTWHDLGKGWRWVATPEDVNFRNHSGTPLGRPGRCICIYIYMYMYIYIYVYIYIVLDTYLRVTFHLDLTGIYSGIHSMRDMYIYICV